MQQLMPSHGTGHACFLDNEYLENRVYFISSCCMVSTGLWFWDFPQIPTARNATLNGTVLPYKLGVPPIYLKLLVDYL